MEDNKFWLAVWRTLGWTLFGIAAAIGGCSSVADYRVQQLVVAGTNPIAARCAIWGNGNTNGVQCHEAMKIKEQK